jgi:hypothetical protein
MWILEEFVLSGTHICSYYFEGDAVFLIEMTWILATAWEILVLCLAVWITIKHFYELQRASTGWAVRDCFMVLIQTHLFYFARWGRNLNVHSYICPLIVFHTSFIAVSCLRLVEFSPEITVCHPMTDSSISDHLSRTSICRDLIYFMVLFQFPNSCRCRCLCWGHASSLAFETVTLNSWPTLKRELPWLQLLSRSAYMFQLMVMCRLV